MYKLIVSFMVGDRLVWQMPSDIDVKHARRMDIEEYQAVADAAKREFIKQVQGDNHAKSNQKGKTKKNT